MMISGSLYGEELRRKGTEVIKKLSQAYPDADCTLDHRHEPWKLMVSGILSAQCTDARVNIITPELFSKYPTPHKLSAAKESDLREIIRSCGFFRVKSDSIKRSMQMLIERYDGVVPDKLEELTKFPGVGRKIANLILGDSFSIPAIVVDTHCIRVSGRIGFTKSKDPYRIEKDLAAVLPRESWIAYGHMAVAHGRAVCVARNQDCRSCVLNKLCDTGAERLESD